MHRILYWIHVLGQPWSASKKTGKSAGFGKIHRLGLAVQWLKAGSGTALRCIALRYIAPHFALIKGFLFTLSAPRHQPGAPLRSPLAWPEHDADAQQQGEVLIVLATTRQAKQHPGMR